MGKAEYIAPQLSPEGRYIMCCDRGIIGTEWWYLSAPPDTHMYIPDSIRKCVVFIGYRLADGTQRLAGTGFFVGRPLERGASTGSVVTHSFAYLVTAKHVLENIASKDIDEVLIRLNSRNGEAKWLSTSLNRWLYHPTEKQTVDVALHPAGWMGSRQWDHMIFPIAGFATPEYMEAERVGLGDEVVIVGLFAHHHGSAKNIPIIRIGNIAAMPEERVITAIGDIDAYLVEARSIGGLSGSPVFVNQGAVRVRNGRIETHNGEGAISFLGLMHGHYDEKTATADKVNVGIGIVVPAPKILEVLDQKVVMEQENAAREELREQVVPAMDAVREEAEFTQEEFASALRKVSRRTGTLKSDSETK